MLSAGKVKTDEEILQFMDGRPVVMSWKLDGLTLVLRYENGTLQQAITRGREGIVGEDVTHTVRVMSNVPLQIPCQEPLEVRGEGVVSWASFNRLNETLDEPYAHPRGLAAGSVRKLNAEESRERGVEFYAFDLISNAEMEAKKSSQLAFLLIRALMWFHTLCWIPPFPQSKSWHRRTGWIPSSTPIPWTA